MIRQFRKVSGARKLIAAACVVLAPLALIGPVLLAGAMPENGQKFGVVVTGWTLAGLAAVLAWKAAK